MVLSGNTVEPEQLPLLPKDTVWRYCKDNVQLKLFSFALLFREKYILYRVCVGGK